MLKYKNLIKVIKNQWFLSIVFICFFAYLLYPFVDVTKLETFYSDSAVILNMITESTPWKENIYVWHDGRSGSSIFLLSKAFYLLFGPEFVLRFINTLIAIFLAAGFSIPILLKKNKPVFFPVGVIFVLIAIRLLPVQYSELFVRVVMDLGHRPDLLFFLSAAILLSYVNFYEKKTHYWPLAICITIASWINDMALFLFLTLCILFTLIDFYKHKRIEIWYWVIFFAALSSIVILKHLTPYSTQIYQLATFEQFKGNFIKALTNISGIFPKFLWGIMLLLNVLFVIIVQKARTKSTITQFYLKYWVMLWVLIGVAFILPFFSKWFYSNKVAPRYLVTSLELLILASSVSFVTVTQYLIRNVRSYLKRNIILIIILLILILPMMCISRLEASKPHSLKYQSGQVLSQNCNAVIGDYSKGYVYIVGGMGKLKTASYDFDRSPTNLQRVLNSSNLCVIEDSEQEFKSAYNVKNTILKPRYAGEMPKTLPDGNYFKHYVVS